MGGITQSLFCLLRAARALGSSCEMGASEGTAGRGSRAGGSAGQRYLGGAPALCGNRGRVCLASGIPGGTSISGGHDERPAHPREPHGTLILPHPDIGLLRPVRLRAASGAPCEGEGSGGWGEPLPRHPRAATTRSRSPRSPKVPRRMGQGAVEQREGTSGAGLGTAGAVRERSGSFGGSFGFVSQMMGNSWAGRALPQPPPGVSPPSGLPTPRGQIIGH